MRLSKINDVCTCYRVFSLDLSLITALLLNFVSTLFKNSGITIKSLANVVYTDFQSFVI